MVRRVIDVFHDFEFPISLFFIFVLFFPGYRMNLTTRNSRYGIERVGRRLQFQERLRLLRQVYYAGRTRACELRDWIRQFINQTLRYPWQSWRTNHLRYRKSSMDGNALEGRKTGRDLPVVPGSV